jgi:hypothetical protein
MRRKARHENNPDANAGTVAGRVGKAGSKAVMKKWPVASDQCSVLGLTGHH